MVVDAEFFCNEVGDAGRRPQFRAISMRPGTLEQKADQTLALFGRQFRGPSGRRFELEARVALGIAGIAPAHHTAGVAIEAAADFVEREAGINQFHGFAAAVFEQQGGAKGSHGDTLHRGYP